MARRRSNTVGNKIKEEDNQQDRMHNSVILEEPPLIKITMRRTNKPARIVEIPALLNGRKLMEIIENQFYIPQNKQIIFWKGRRFQKTRETQIFNFSLTDKDIFHVHNRQIVERETICIYIQFLNSDLIKYQQIKIMGNTNEIILNAFEDNLLYEAQDIQKFMFSQSGRYINIMNNFLKEAIEDDSIIIAVLKQKDKQLLNFKLEARQIQIMDSRAKLVKKTSLNFLDTQSEEPNFKKKSNHNVYKSLIIPESKQIVWKEDASIEFCKKKLLKRLIKKKVKKCEKIQQQEKQKQEQEKLEPPQIQEDKFSNISQYSSENSRQDPCQSTVNGIVKGNIGNILNQKQQKQRLFQSERLPKRVQKTAVKDLKPPIIGNDFFEQIEDIEFGQEQIEADNQNLKASAPLISLQNSLKASIGKNRGLFVPFITIDPHQHFNENNNDDEYEDG